jgi:hypothetical protein
VKRTRSSSENHADGGGPSSGGAIRAGRRVPMAKKLAPFHLGETSARKCGPLPLAGPAASISGATSSGVYFDSNFGSMPTKPSATAVTAPPPRRVNAASFAAPDVAPIVIDRSLCDQSRSAPPAKYRQKPPAFSSSDIEPLHRNRLRADQLKQQPKPPRTRRHNLSRPQLSDLRTPGDR